MGFKDDIERLRDSLKKAKIHGFDSGDSDILDFKEKRIESYNRVIKSSLEAIKGNNLGEFISHNKTNGDKIIEINEYIKDLGILFEQKKIDELIEILDKILVIYNGLVILKSQKFVLNFNSVPLDIRDEIKADFFEMDKCFSSNCYRSVVILLGRILEVALHRKYYEVSGVDALEKSPGIGLGKLIAKLVEREVKFDPGLTQQIHLINQVRVGSVHKKKDIFNPSFEQTQAMILYTIDVVNKLF